MMCCGCLKWLQDLVHPEDSNSYRTALLLLTEVLRWLAFVVPLYLAVWRWAYFNGFPDWFIGPNATTEFWCVVTGLIVSITLFAYIPSKLWIVSNLVDARNKWGWRPSILQYLFLSACPSLVIIAWAIRSSDKYGSLEVMDSDTVIALQMTVMGLTITEWMAKLREEVFSYDLIHAMATDFFFAYDAIFLLMMSRWDTVVFKTYWFYVTFIIGFISMFNYVPMPPASICDTGNCGKYNVPKGAVASILVSMICVDIPFAFVRLSYMYEYGHPASDLIRPAKNIAMIIFGCIKLHIIHKNHTSMNHKRVFHYNERRRAVEDVAEKKGFVDNASSTGTELENTYCNTGCDEITPPSGGASQGYGTA